MIPQTPAGADPEVVALVFSDPELNVRVTDKFSPRKRFYGILY